MYHNTLSLRNLRVYGVSCLLSLFSIGPVRAQFPISIDNPESIPSPDSNGDPSLSPENPFEQSFPEVELQPRSPDADFLNTPPEGQLQEGLGPEAIPGDLYVNRFEIEGSSVFSIDELQQVTERFTNRILSFADLLEVSSAITQLYIDHGYKTSGAFIPPQTIKNDVVTIRILEGKLVQPIEVIGSVRLNPKYVRDRLNLAVSTPLNIDRLLEGLQLLLQDPLIENASAELSAGSEPGTNRLEVRIEEANTFRIPLGLDNGRSSLVGSFRQEVGISEANLFGQGDGFGISYRHTEGSNEVDVNYAFPLNARDGKLRFRYTRLWSEVIRSDFEILDILTDRNKYLVGFRQPIVRTPRFELAMNLDGTFDDSRTTFIKGLRLPFPSRGANSNGRTALAALRFGQDATYRDNQQVLAGRSELSWGLDALGSTILDTEPDSRYFLWRGQGQWVRLLAPSTLFVLRGEMQLADRPIAPAEQFQLGGANNLLGYPQATLLTDNGSFASAEFRLPIYRSPNRRTTLQVVPSAGMGRGWNSGRGLPDPDPNFLASVGLGLLVTSGDRLSARFDWGVPLVDANTRNENLQEMGLHFSLTYSAF